MKPLANRDLAGVSMVEVMIAASICSLVLGGLILSAVSIQKSFQAAEIYISSQLATTRLIDFLDSDLRTATAVSFNGAAFRDGERMLGQGAVLEIRKPKFYRSEVPGSSDYQAIQELTATVDAFGNLGVDYGTPGAPETIIQYKRVYRGETDSICFVRVEDGIEQVIVEYGDEIDCDLRMSDAGQRVEIDTWFFSKFGDGTARVNSSGAVMLRNPRTDI